MLEWKNLRLAPDDAGAGSADAPEPELTEPVDAAEPMTEAPPPEPAAETPSAFSVREYAKRQGYDFSHFEDEEKATAAVFQAAQQAMRQAEQYQRQLQQVQPYLSKYQEYQRQLEAQQKQAEQKKAWQAPEYDPRWLTKFRVDEQGNVQGDVEAYQKAKAYAEWKQQQEERFWQDPASVLRPALVDPLKDELRREMQAMLQERMLYDRAAQIEAEVTTSFTPDQQAKYLGIVNLLNQGGMRDVNVKDQIARMLVQQAAPPAKNEAAKKTFTQRAARQPSYAAVANGAANSEPSSLRSELARAFKQAGFTEDTLSDDEE